MYLLADLIEDSHGETVQFPPTMSLSLSPLIRYDTSTWTYEGWQSQVYHRQYAESTFIREYLGEYCQY